MKIETRNYNTLPDREDIGYSFDILPIISVMRVKSENPSNALEGTLNYISITFGWLFWNFNIIIDL